MRRCDRQQQALCIVTAALAAPSSHLPSDCRQEALACMHRSTLFPLPTCSSTHSLHSHPCRLRAVIASSSLCSSGCGDNDPLRSLPAVHAGALAHGNQVAPAAHAPRTCLLLALNLLIMHATPLSRPCVSWATQLPSNSAASPLWRLCGCSCGWWAALAAVLHDAA